MLIYVYNFHVVQRYALKQNVIFFPKCVEYLLDSLQKIICEYATILISFIFFYSIERKDHFTYQFAHFQATTSIKEFNKYLPERKMKKI